jgi:hypothetical protein
VVKNCGMIEIEWKLHLIDLWEINLNFGSQFFPEPVHGSSRKASPPGEFTHRRKWMFGESG